MEPKEDSRSIEELREDMWWDDEGMARDPDDEEDDGEYQDRAYGREF